jgi:uncharacterized cupin superfamily protein
MPDEATNVWDEVPDWGGVGARRLVRSPAGSLGATLWEFQPGGSQFVYHFHHGSEELLVVLSGEPTVRLHSGDRRLRSGDVVPFPPGAEGGHQIRNESQAVARVLIVSSSSLPEVAEYPDTGKIGILIHGHGWEYYRRSDAVPNPDSDAPPSPG